MKIVKFKNGKYGIRRWTIFGWIFKTVGSDSWHGKQFRATLCEIGTLEKAKSLYNDVTDLGTPI